MSSKERSQKRPSRHVAKARAAGQTSNEESNRAGEGVLGFSLLP